MYCKIITDDCIACGLCQVIAPGIFDYNDQGIVGFIGEPNATHQFIPEQQADFVLQAAKKCPVRAIQISQEHLNF